MVFWPALFFALALKGSDKSLSYSLNQSVRELLYFPIGKRVKDKAKIFIDMFLNRFAKSIGALILIILVYGIDLDPRYFSLFSTCLIVIWLIFNYNVSKEYVIMVKKKLDLKWSRADKIVREKVDLDFMKSVFDALESKEKSPVLYAMHRYDLLKQDKLTPDAMKLLAGQSEDIQPMGPGFLSDLSDSPFVPEEDVSVDQKELDKEIKEIMSLDVYQNVINKYISERVNDKSEAGKIARMEIAKAIGLMGSSASTTQKLETLLFDPSPEVSRYAIDSASRLKQRVFIPGLIHNLENPSTRDDACSALRKFGSKITGTLADYLADTEEKNCICTDIVSVLANIGTQEAADFLLWELQKGKREIKTEIIDALDLMRSEHSELIISENSVKGQLLEQIKKSYRILIDFCNSSLKEENDRKIKELPKILSVHLNNVFKLLGLIYPHDDIFRAYQNIKTGTKDSVDYAIEHLDNILSKEKKDLLFPIIEDFPLKDRAKRCSHILKNFPEF
jgi:hypothetical protein